MGHDCRKQKLPVLEDFERKIKDVQELTVNFVQRRISTSVDENNFIVNAQRIQWINYHKQGVFQFEILFFG